MTLSGIGWWVLSNFPNFPLSDHGVHLKILQPPLPVKSITHRIYKIYLIFNLDPEMNNKEKCRMYFFQMFPVESNILIADDRFPSEFTSDLPCV